MATVVALNASPASLLRSLRGRIVEAGPAFPDVLHVEVRDVRGGLWRLATQDAEWSGTDAGSLTGRSVDDAWIDEHTGGLHLKLSEGALLIDPRSQEAVDDPPNWELITPDGLLLEFGPGLRWQISSAGAVLRREREGQ